MSIFPKIDFPHEALAINNLAAYVCSKGANQKGAKHYANNASSICDRIKIKQLNTLPDSSQFEIYSSGSSMKKPLFNHPSCWAGFYLVGRIE